MEILVNEILIELINTSEDVYIPSSVLCEPSDVENEFIVSKIKKALNNDLRKAEFISGKHNIDLLNYEEGDLSKLRESISEAYYNIKKDKEIFENSAILMIECRLNNSPALFIFDVKLKSLYSVDSEYGDNGVMNRIVSYNALLSKDISKDDRYIAYYILNKEIRFYENDEYHLMDEELFSLTSSFTPTEVVKKVEKEIKDISEKYNIPLSDTLPEFKAAIADNDRISIKEIGEAVFKNDSEAKMDFELHTKKEGLDIEVNKDDVKLLKKDKTLKYITDSGIELTIPASFLKRKDKLEITTHGDGTVTIELKNITKLKNK